VRRWVAVVLAIIVVSSFSILRFGGFLLLDPDPLPPRAEVAITLHGSDEGTAARLAEAIRLLREDRVNSVMLSVGAVRYWGEWLPSLVRHYLRTRYGEETSDRIVLCELLVDSTAQEALALRHCLEQRGWRSVIVVTSDFHTRRAKLIWQESISGADPPFVLAVVGVADGSYDPRDWWHNRRYAKTWLLEVTKLTWYLLEGIPTERR